MKTKFIFFTLILELLFSCSKKDLAPDLSTIGQSNSLKISLPKSTSIGALVTEAADFSPRSFHTTTVFKDMLWVIGGQDADGRNNEVWYSTDGMYWKMTPANARFSPRTGHTINVFDNKLWVIGGDDGNAKNDVWYSSDGFNWIEAVSEADFPRRTLHGAAVFNNRLWVIGGLDQDLFAKKALKNDVWQSDDGVNWVRVTSEANFGERRNHTVNVFNGLLWVIGGAGPGFGEIRKNDVWYSLDGLDWTQAPSTGPLLFSPRSSHTTTVFDNKLWLIGGLDEQVGFTRDIWTTTNGRSWERYKRVGAFSPRAKHTTTTFNNKLWLIGGSTNDGNKNDVWTIN